LGAFCIFDTASNIELFKRGAMIKVKLILLIFPLVFFLGTERSKAQGIIVKIAGDSISEYKGDGGLADTAEFAAPNGVAVDAQGHVYIADMLNNRVRMFSIGGYINTYAGDSSTGLSGNGGPATDAALHLPAGVCTDTAGNIYITDKYNDMIRAVDHTTHIITDICGIGTGGSAGDGGPATIAYLEEPNEACVDRKGNIYIADYGNSRIRKVNITTGDISTVAGDSVSGYNGDSMLAVNSELSYPCGVAVDTEGNLYIADYGNARIRKVAAETGIITTICGNGTEGTAPNGTPATDAMINQPNAICVDNHGIVYFSDRGNNVIRGIFPDGNIYTLAGSGNWGFFGDGGLAVNARFKGPTAITTDDSGYLYVVDGGNSVVWRVSPPFTGVKNVLQAVSVNVYPVPNSGIFNVDTKDWYGTKITLMNVLGQQIFSTELSAPSTTVNVGTISPGLYLLNICSPTSSTVKKIIAN